MTATLRDVARMAGVHPGTASRAMNPDMAHLVNAATAQRVQEAAERLGYIPNSLARSLKTSRTHSLGVLVPDIADPLFPPILRGIEDTASQAGYTVVVANTDGDPERTRRQAAGLRARQVDGLILAPAGSVDPFVAELEAAAVPLVLVNRVDAEKRLASVAGDEVSGVRQALAHLHGLGHRRIAHLAGPADTPAGAARLRAFREVAAAYGLSAEQCPVTEAAADRIEEGARAAARLLDGDGRITAVLAAHDLLALGCCETLTARGLRCPEDVSVVGFDGLPLLDRVSPPLTTVGLPQYTCGTEAARLLLDRLRDPEAPPESVLLPVSLTVRGSTAPVRDTAPSAVAGAR
ncbi:LacI family DNA-binding transcriptional regulator [Streptomyces sp. NA04227]|uniref:LacI family DNA-binding transcriptional regulator n=1 Tax=Streptomyces sp. NA04227 TaxID=2742136 RepID=UPI001C37A092|nr:LacI family DNA-binding transcriptional regulator [Streptomyces sp. NA04227]